MAEQVFNLSKPIKVHSGKSGAQEVTEIKLREPTADDVFEIESPTIKVVLPSNRGVEVRTNGMALRRWIERLSGIGAGELGAMGTRDLSAMENWLNGELNDAKN